jgi:hypothetical protein
MDVLRSLEEKGISIRVASPKLVMEEVNFDYSSRVCQIFDSAVTVSSVTYLHKSGKLS